MSRSSLKIKEIKNGNNMNINKVQMKCDGLHEDERVDNPLQSINTPPLLYFVGQPASGKSNLIIKLLKGNKGGSKLYSKKYVKVYIISPSFNTIEKGIDLPDEQIFTDFNVENLEMIKDMAEETEGKKLLILDDCIAQLKKNMTTFLKFIYNRRHFEGGSFSVWISGQVYNKLPREIRQVLTGLFLFQIKSPVQLKDIAEEFIPIPYKEFKDLTEYCFDKKYNFMWIDLNKPFEDGGCFKCFNELKLNEGIKEKMVADDSE